MSRFFYCYAECQYAQCYFAECHYAECQYAECRYAECHRAIVRTFDYNSMDLHKFGPFFGTGLSCISTAKVTNLCLKVQA